MSCMNTQSKASGLQICAVHAEHWKGNQVGSIRTKSMAFMSNFGAFRLYRVIVDGVSMLFARIRGGVMSNLAWRVVP
jgi:hypothetical protein